MAAFARSGHIVIAAGCSRHGGRLSIIEQQQNELEDLLQQQQGRFSNEKALAQQLMASRQGNSQQAEITDLQQQLAQAQQGDLLVQVDVDTRTVANVIADWTGVPLSSLMKDEQTGLLTLENEIGSRVVGQDISLEAILFSLSKEYPRREQVMQYGEDDLHFITRLLGEAGIWFRFTADTRLNIDVVAFYDGQDGYEKGLTLPSVPPSGQHSEGVDSVWGMACHHSVVQKQVSTRDYNYRQATEDMNARADVTRGDSTTYGEAYHYADNWLTAGVAHDRNPAPESGAFYARIRHERYLNGQTQTRAITGCPPGDQGKANASHDGNLLSQIVLHELYSVAFSAGAPLKVPGNVLGADLRKNVWRIMDIERMNEFAIAPDLVNRFNAWRELTLNLPPSKEKITDEQAAEYIPPRASVSLEKAFENQIAWITAWRIDRYAKGTMLTTPFYERATDSDALPGALESSEAKRELQQGAVRARRQEKIASQPADKMDELVLEAGVKDFDPDIAKTQLKQAATEFGEDYRQQFRSPTSIGQLVLAVIPRNSIFLLNIDDRPREYALIKASAETKVATLFPPPGEASNADTPAGLVRALFDDQVHDSRAWFMQYTLGTREPWGGYFLYRMIYFSNKCNKSLSPLTIAGDVVGAATLVGGVIFSFKQKGMTAKLAGLAGTAGLLTLESEAMDYLTGLAIPMVDNADALKAFTSEPGVVTAQQREIISEKRLEMAKSIIQSGWLEKAQSLVTT
ncbi:MULTISPECIES: type VI secretion system tip protein VgrG [Pantoea]|uniref:T6SS Phospholipase effector Tle1-like C-terminal domain-containing protein n=1 Tax=Pantoea brenneri TaxID=472694 RepID=A0AAX3J4K4_9GAMM|nr:MULTISPECIES: type VI secretion system tip protein VgrG [Pantoea]MDH2124188.1 type VI secretion system tip protein VgrG [Pantoea brenneri]VXB57213.1 hypothetical protein PANT111_160113 [Pantoea brenneri]